MPEKKDTEELILEAKGFFETYKKEIGKSIREDKKVVLIDFNDLSEYSHTLSEILLASPEELFQILETALDDIGLIKNARVRLLNVPRNQDLRIGHIRAKHLNRLISITGIVRQASEVRPQVVNAKFECPSCGTIISVLQVEKKFREPTRCSCGRKGQFRLLTKEMVDAQRLVIEEAPESLFGGEQPRRLSIFLQEDLVEPKMEEKTTPGSRINIIGVLKEIPIPLQTGSISTRFDLALEANNIIPLEETFEDVKIDDEDERQIQELATDPKLFEKMADSIAPSIWGYEEIKKSLVLQMFSGVRKVSKDKSVKRGDIHVFLIGDPGVAKSITLKFISDMAPKGRYIVGRATSGAGITATVVRDEFLKGWSLEAGAMVLANKGIVCIDEIEKMDPTDRSAMHEAMEQQCMLPDFKLMLSNGTTKKIGPLIDNLIQKNKNKIIKGKDCEILPTQEIELLSTDFTNHFPIKAQRVSRHLAPKKFIKIELTNGKQITVTPEHPCWIVKDSKITTIPAESLKQGMYFPIPSKLEINPTPYKKENDQLCKILGYHLSDGCYELNRGKKTGIQFWNNNKELIDDYFNSIQTYFKKKPIITKRKHQFAVRVISKKVIQSFLKLDKNLLEKGPIKKIPQQIMQLPKQNIKYLIRSLFDGDGTVTFQKRGGCRTTLAVENKALAKQVSTLLLRFGIQSSIFRDKGSNVYRLDISGQENLSKFLINISFLSQHKKQRLKQYCEKTKTYRTIRDVIPGCTDKISKIFKKLKISQNKTIGHSIDLHVEKHRKFLQKLVLIAQQKIKELENSKQIIDPKIKSDLMNIKRLAFGYARWMKIKQVSKTQNKDTKWVYDVTIEPYHTFISNDMILHNTVTISKANVQACYSEDTEVLTEKGWKKYNQVKNLKIAQYHPETNKIQFLLHKGLYIYNYNKKMHHFKNKRNDILVTPNHKMLAKEVRHKKFKEIQAKDIKYSRIKFKNAGEFVGKQTPYITIPGIKHKQNRKHPKYTHQHKDKQIPTDLWLEFLGYYITEGGVETKPTIGIVQKKGKECEKIKKCLEKLTKILGGSLSKIDCKQYMRFKITQTQLYNYLKDNGEKCYNKTLNLNFSEFSKQQLKILYNAMMLGDGSSDGKYFSVTSKRLADEFQAITHLIGKSASQHIHYKQGTRGKRKTMYRTVISKRIEPMIYKKSIKTKNYKGKVWCFSTKTGFFVTKRNGKIAIQGNTLQAQTSVLAAGNPKLGRFEPFQSIAQQIDLPPALINRFDIIFTLRDIPDKIKDESIATHVLSSHQKGAVAPPVERELFKKYVAYAKQRIIPALTDEAVNEIKDFYVKLRSSAMSSDALVRPIPISARQLEALVRLSEAHAKMRLNKTVTKLDAKIAIALMKYYLMQVGYDEESKQFDIDKIAVGVSSSQRSKVILVRETITKLEEKLGKFIPTEELKKELEKKMSEDEIEDSIQKLISSGDVFKPRRGFIQRI